MAGRGSNGTCHIPVAPRNQRGNRASADEPDSPAPPSRLLRVLVVDDDLAVCSTLAGHLSRAGMDPTTATDGQTCLDLLSREHFDAVVLDHRLPDVLGLTVLSQLRFRGDATPVLMLTGYPDYRTAHEVGTYSNTAYESKPIGETDFLRAVRSLLADRVSLAQAGRPRGDHTNPRPLRVDFLTKCLQDGIVDRHELSEFIEHAPRDVLLAALAQIIADRSSSWIGVVAACRSFHHVITSWHTSSLDVRRAVREWTLEVVERQQKPLDALLERLQTMLGQQGVDEASRSTDIFDAALGASERDLGMVLQHEFKVSLRRLRLIVRVRPVIAALVNTDELVSQIGYRNGYDHPSSVDRDLQRLLGMSPSALRRVNRSTGTPY